MGNLTTAVSVLGVDIGGVITRSTSGVDGEDTFFGSRPMESPSVPGVFDALRDLTERFGYRVWLVSKAGPRVSVVSRNWLHHVGFWEATGIPRGNVEFVGKRSDKATVCERLGVTHFVDDRLDVLDYLRPAVDQLYWFTETPSAAPQWVTAALGTWPDMRSRIANDLG